MPTLPLHTARPTTLAIRRCLGPRGDQIQPLASGRSRAHQTRTLAQPSPPVLRIWQLLIPIFVACGRYRLLMASISSMPGNATFRERTFPSRRGHGSDRSDRAFSDRTEEHRPAARCRHAHLDRRCPRRCACSTSTSSLIGDLLSNHYSYPRGRRRDLGSSRAPLCVPRPWSASLIRCCPSARRACLRARQLADQAWEERPN